MRLKRVYETAEEEGQSIEQVALERFGSLAAFEEAKEERRVLDEREGRRPDHGRGRDSERKGKGRDVTQGGEKGLMFTDLGGSGASSRSASFRRPGESGPSTPSHPPNRRLDSLRLPSQAASPLMQSHTPIPSVMTPTTSAASTGRRPISPSNLNRLQAKVLRAKLLGSPDADALEREYEDLKNNVGLGASSANTGRGGVRTKVVTEVLPTLDGRGRLYDVGHGKEDDAILPGNRRKKPEKVFDSRCCLLLPSSLTTMVVVRNA